MFLKIFVIMSAVGEQNFLYVKKDQRMRRY